MKLFIQFECEVQQHIYEILQKMLQGYNDTNVCKSSLL